MRKTFLTNKTMDFLTRMQAHANGMAFALFLADGDRRKASEIYRRFVDIMKKEYPSTDIGENPFTDLADAAYSLAETLNKYAAALRSLPPEVFKPSDYSTIILPGMPHLEWMTENLTGFGGTEVDGRWYYTYDEAVAAAKQLGDGWRLPTRGEMVDLCDLGSTWDDERKGRWFGGNHDTDHAGSLFLPATGYRNRETGALDAVGTNGYAWSSSTYGSAGTNAHCGGILYFHASLVSQLSPWYRTFAYSVRCVRNVK